MILYGGLAIVCFIIAGIFSFLPQKIADVEQVVMNKAMVAEAERVVGRRLTDEERHRIVKDKGIIEKVTKALRER